MLSAQILEWTRFSNIFSRQKFLTGIASNLVVNICGHLRQHVVEPEDVRLRQKLFPAVAVGSLHHAIDIKLIVAALVQTGGRKERWILRQVLEYGAIVRAARQPRQRKVNDGCFDAQGVDSADGILGHQFNKDLKGQCHEIFCFWFFSWISFPPAPEYSIN